MLKQNHHRLVALAVGCAMMLPMLSGFGQERNVEQRIGEIEEQIHALITKGEQLHERGQQEEARELFAQSRAMQEELRAWIEQLERQGAQRDRQRAARDGGHFINVIEHLEHAMVILNENGNTELAVQINRVADQIRERVQRRERDAQRRDRDEPRERREGRDLSERDFARAQIETLGLALRVLREAERGDASDLVQRAIRAREVGLEGRRDAEARQIRERSPDAEQTRRVLGMAIEQYQEFGAHDRAERLAQAVREFFPQRDRERTADREREGDGERDRQRDRDERDRERERPGRSDREHLAHQIEIIRMAIPAILETGREDTAELLEHAIRARELVLEGARGEDAQHVIESAPDLGAMVEILGWASRLWDEFGHETKAETVGELAEQMRAEWRQRQERGQRERDNDRSEGRERESGQARNELRAALERRLAELEAALERTRAEIRELRRDGGIR